MEDITNNNTNIGNRITIIGGGSVYIPVIIECLIPFLKNTPIKEIYLVDIDPKKLELVSNFCSSLVNKLDKNIKVHSEANIKKALPNSSVVITMFRVGGLDARNSDELTGMKYSLGQETQGYGGFASCLRGAEPLKDIVNLMQEICPDAWLLNITNPVGIMTRVALDLGVKKVVGICELPFNMRKAIASVLNNKVSAIDISYAGLNHLGWISKVKLNGKDVSDKVIKEKFNEVMLKACPSNIRSLLTNCNLLEKAFGKYQDKFNHGTLFSPYLIFYYFFKEITEFQRKTSWTRVGKIKKVNHNLYEQYKNKQPDINGEWKDTLKERGGYLLGETIAPLVHDMLQQDDKGVTHFVCTKNNGTIPFLPKEVIVEVPVKINWNGVKPIQKPDLLSGKEKSGIRSLIKKVAKYESLTAKAAETGSFEYAIQALSKHPLINSEKIAKVLFDLTLVKDRVYLPQFKQ